MTLDRSGTSLVVAVEDDGVGIPEGWTVDGAANLGLRIAVTLVETELSGELDVERRPAGGTRATIRLPVQA